jgi:effector-binding domain-containing protein
MRKVFLILITILFIFAPLRYLIGLPMISIRVKIQEVEPFVYCSIRHKGPFSEIEQVIQNLIATMRGQNVYPQGPMIGIYHTVPGPEDPENMQMEWEIGFPITEQALVQAPLERKIWEHTLVASAIHIGPYEETGETITDIFQWMEANGYDSAGPVLERYLETGTPEGPPESQKAEIWIPCRKR